MGKWHPLPNGSASVASTAGLSARELDVGAAPWSSNTSCTPIGEYDPVSDRTFLAYTGLERDLFVLYYDHSTDTMSTPVHVDVNPIPDMDVHNAPTLAIDHDGLIHVVWGSHNTPHRHAISDTARDISSWTVSDIHAGTYPKLVVLDDGDILLFDRVGAGHGSTFPSHEYASVRRYSGGAWGTATSIIDTTGTPESFSDAYLWFVSYAAGIIHLTWTVARGTKHNDQKPAMYHATYDPADGTLATIDGTDLGSVITWAEHPSCLVYNAGGDLLDAATHLVRDDGSVILAFRQHVASAFTVITSTWDGTSWTNTDTGIRQAHQNDGAVVLPYFDGLIGLFSQRESGAAFGDVGVWMSGDGVSWTSAGVIIEGATGEGFGLLGPIAGNGPWLVVGEEWPTSYPWTDATESDLLPLYAVAAPLARHTHKYAPTGHTHDAADLPVAADETVFAPTYTVTDGTSLDMDITFVWGIDGDGDPYYNSAGVTAGDEAVLVLDNTTGTLSLRPVEV